ncbi:MAG: hypothetical protein QOG13_411 [Sphingomonadales bacterium]|jgi:hypothetical protein|nr:hypothetical protein [Sphingomonadales bacterium]
MIAARQFQDFGRGLGRNAFDLPVAGLAALAVAFFAFAVPADLLGRAVEASGLPSLFAAAEPPLGFKARAILGIAGALAVFALVFATLRALDRIGAARTQVAPAAADDGMPRLRRRDVHPDAPARRPIHAARDFGEPAPPAGPEARDPTPLWLAGADVAEVEPEAAVEPASLAELMERLERGLARRRSRRAFAPPPQAAQPQVFPEAGDDRLQSAIQGLQRLAARGD